MLIPASFMLLVAVAVVADPKEPPEAIDIPSMLLRLIEQADVPARESGILANVHVVEGQMVEEGAAIAQIDDAEARIVESRAKIEWEVAQANAANTTNVRFAKKSVEVSQAELARSVESNQRFPKSISESEMDRLRLIVERGRLEVEQSEHELRTANLTQRIKENDYLAAQERVKRHKITAPLAGIVVQIQRHRGEWVQPGETIVRILRLDRLRAEGFVKGEPSSEDLLGRQARLLVDLPKGRTAEVPGKIVFVDPELDPVNAQVRIWAEIENRDLRLQPGMKARMILSRKPQP